MTVGMRLMLITDMARQDPIAPIKAALRGSPTGSIAVQLRAKSAPDRQVCAWGHELRALTTAHGATLVVNARVDIAQAVAADGVQLPERGLPIAEVRRWVGTSIAIGASRHDARGVAAAQRDGADYVLWSPVFDVPDKGFGQGTSALAELVTLHPIPIVALGGIAAANIQQVVATGVSGVAVQRAIYDSKDPARTAQEILAAWPSTS